MYFINFLIVTVSVCSFAIASDVSNCTTPDGLPGNCISIYNCDILMRFLENARKPLSDDVKEYLREYHCGVNNKDVCCEIIETLPEKIASSVSDITKHANLHLLTNEECGIVHSLNNSRTCVSSLNEFPWMALISYRNESKLDFHCGGTLISEYYVLTAAHCVTNLKGAYVSGVRLGEYIISRKSDCEKNASNELICYDVQDTAISDTTHHEEFNPNDLSNDIGLIRLRMPANILKNNIGVICLPIQENLRAMDIDRAVVTGWGATGYSSRSDILLKAEIPIRKHDDCQGKYNQVRRKISAEHQICAGDEINGIDACAGDSGGPLKAKKMLKDGLRYVQYGIISFGPEKCGRGRPSVYTNVVPYLPWILDNIKP